jgi:hypothetical protein
MSAKFWDWADNPPPVEIRLLDSQERPRLKKSVWQVVVVANVDEAAKRFAKKMTFIIRHTPVFKIDVRGCD